MKYYIELKVKIANCVLKIKYYFEFEVEIVKFVYERNSMLNLKLK